MTFAKKAELFYKKLSFTSPLPDGIHVMNPYRQKQVRLYVSAFLEKFFCDSKPRTMVFGINPGRFGAGLTGITFTDPIALQDYCGIPNDFRKERELSSRFIYAFIEKWGGSRVFFSKFFLTAVSPLGFIREDRNYNYYDNPDLFKAAVPFILKAIREQMAMGANPKAAIVLGRGRNLTFFNRINEEHGFFKEIYPLDHPRFIMQYRRRYVDRYLNEYQKTFLKASS